MPSESPERDDDDLKKKIVSWRPAVEKPEEPDVPKKPSVHQSGMDRTIEVNKWPPKRIAGVAAVALFVGAVLYQYFLGDHSAKLNVQLDRITVSTVSQGLFQEFIPVRGTVLPIQTVYLDALEGGRVEEIFVEEGSLVEKGTAILRLSDPNLEMKVMNQEAMLFEQLSNMENIRLNMETQSINRKQQLITFEQRMKETSREYTRNEELMSRNLIAKKVYEKSKEDYDYAQRRLTFMKETVFQDSLYRVSKLSNLESQARRLQMNLDEVKRPLENLVLKAPIGGQLTALDAEIGELKSRGRRIGQVDMLEGYKVQVQVDEFYIARINKDLKGSTTLSGETFNLTIRRVYPEVREGQFEVDMEFAAQAPEGIRRGQTLQIRLELGDPEEAILLSRGGFYQTTGGNWVFVVEPSGDVAIRRPVRIGRQNPEFFEVLDGLNPGERVVTSSYESYEEIEKLVLSQ